MTDQPRHRAPRFTDGDKFEIGGEALFAPGRVELESPEGQESEATSARSPHDALADVRIRVGRLLKAETISFLLGAGASVECGGQLIGSVPPAVERALVKIRETRPVPRSRDPKFYAYWTADVSPEIDVEPICTAWEGSSDPGGSTSGPSDMSVSDSGAAVEGEASK